MTGFDPTTTFVSEALNDEHDVSRLSSGQPELDGWLRRSAAASDGRNITRTHVWTRRGDQERRVVAYYSTMPYVIERGTLSKREGRGLTDHIPCYLLTRLALDRTLQGQQLGSMLLAEAVRRIALSSTGAGGRLIVVDAIDDDAASFYRRHGFEPLPDEPRRLTLRVKDVLGSLDRA